MKVEQFFVKETASIKSVMHRIDLTGLGIAIVVDNGKLLGIVSTGDIRRSIMSGLSNEDSIKNIVNREPVVAELDKLTDPEYCATLQKKAQAKKAHYVPIVDVTGKVIHLCYNKELSKENLTTEITKKNKDSVLVVGGAGYLGSVLVPMLLDAGFKVRVLDRLMYGSEGLDPLKGNENFELMVGDIRNITTVTKALQNIDAVIHLAAIVGDPASTKIPVETLETNLLSTKVLAEACKYQQINRFIFASTCSVYGAGDAILTENSPLRPVSHYARSKISSEEAIIQMADENFSPTILRLSTLFGPSPRMRFDLVVNILTAKAIFDKEICIFGGQQWRPLLHTEDAARAFKTVLEAPIEKISSAIFNIGSEQENYQIIKLGHLVKEIFPDITIRVKEQDVDARDYQVSFDKIKQQIGYAPVKSVRDGILEIKEMINRGEVKDHTKEKYSNFLSV